MIFSFLKERDTVLDVNSLLDGLSKICTASLILSYDNTCGLMGSCFKYIKNSYILGF
jgi:hypothetical protein